MAAQKRKKKKMLVEIFDVFESYQTKPNSKFLTFLILPNNTEGY